MITSSQCAERAGFLFKHPCDRPGNLQCQQCGKQICDHHVRLVGGAAMCVACRKPSRDNSEDNSRNNRDDGNDPYFYGSTYYTGWGYYHYTSSYDSEVGGGGEAHGHDADDFTEADGAAMGVVASETFENDMEGS